MPNQSPISSTLTQYFTMLLIITLLVSGSEVVEAAEADLLMKFKASLTNTAALEDWDPSVGPICVGKKSKWTGLICVNNKLYGLRLENMGLGGTIDLETLAQISGLRSLSFANNSFEGPIPFVRRLSGLRALYLSNNRFSGEISHDCFAGIKYLKKVYLGRNGFVGKLPKSLAKLSKLVELNVEGNGFEGKIPKFSKRDWKVLSFANNLLVGPIPKSLSRINQTAFYGNKALCGAPLGPCKPTNKPLMTVIIAVSIATLLCGVVLIAYLKARGAEAQISVTKLGPDRKGEAKKGENSNLHFVRNDGEKFEMEDLLGASAEVLGSGSFGSSYKAILLSGQVLVVKRFRYMNNMGREGFQAHMSRLGRLAHPNLLPIIAYYYTKEEKLVIYKFVENGSLARHLHGKRAAGKEGLDWPTRLKIIKRVSKGLSYLYREFTDLTLPHGHLKSSNVLLDTNLNPFLTEYGFAPLVSDDHAHLFMAAHKSPESSYLHRVSKKSDIWSFGILILEILTGIYPVNYMAGASERGAGDVAMLVESAVREGRVGELFDKEMGGTQKGEAQILKLLKIGLSCCNAAIERRWDWRLVMERIDELRERDDEGGEYSSYVTDWDVNVDSSINSVLPTRDDYSSPLVKSV